MMFWQLRISVDPERKDNAVCDSLLLLQRSVEQICFSITAYTLVSQDNAKKSRFYV